MSFGTQLKKALDQSGMSQADLCRETGLKSSYISQYLSTPDRDPQISTALKIAKALDVSIDFLAGVEDEPSRFYADPMTMRMIEGFQRLPYNGKKSLLEQLDFQLSKSVQNVPNNTVPGVA